MSLKLMNMAWEVDGISCTQKLVLLALCDSADDKGVCSPSVAELAEKCSLSSRGVIKATSDLQEMGYLHKQKQQGESTVYSLVFGSIG